jgi:hypothetical protein
MWSVPRIYRQYSGSNEWTVEFSKGGCEERTYEHEGEESTLLEAVERERLVKIQQAEKGLAGGVVIFEFRR